MFSVQLQAYTPGGAALGELPLPISWQASVVHNDVGALTLDYSTLSAGGQHIAREMSDGLEVALLVWNGTAWVEPRGCRFIRIKQNEVDKADGSQVFRVTLASWGWQLRKAALLAGPFGTDLRRVFTTPTAGGLLNTLISENNARGGIGTQMTIIGGGANDAGGTPWVALPDQPFDYGKDYLSITRGLQEAGALDWATQARGLYVYTADSASLSPDLSSTIRLVLGRDITEAPAEETIEDLVGSLGVSADAGGNVIVDEPTAPAPHGIWEGHLSIGQASDVSAATAMAEAELERVARARQQFTHALVLRDDSKIPLIDYWPGCWLTAPTNSLAESVRLQQVTLTFGKEGYGANVVLNDRFTEYDIRRARLLGNLAGGQVGSGGAPPPIFVDPEASRVPSTPTGFSSSASLSFIGPTPRGVITSSWDAVTTATDSGALSISGYELQWRVGAGAWQTIFTPELSARIENQTPGDSIDTRVRAISPVTVLPSAWSAIATDVVPGDVTAPSVPTGLSIASALRIASVTWAGTLTAAIPGDFARIEIAMGTTATPTTVYGVLTRAGTLQVTGSALGIAIGSTVFARARSVDSTGNVSSYGTAVSVVMAGVAGPDLAANSVTANTIAAGAIDGKLITGATIRSSASNPRTEMNASGFFAYNGSGTETISILGSTSVITGATIRTAATGNRLEMTTAGLIAWTSGAPVAEFLPGGIYIRAGGALVVEYTDESPALRVGDLGSDLYGVEMYDLSGVDVFTLSTNDTTDSVNLTMDGLTDWTVFSTTTAISGASFQIQSGGIGAGDDFALLQMSNLGVNLKMDANDTADETKFDMSTTQVTVTTGTASGLRHITTNPFAGITLAGTSGNNTLIANDRGVYLAHLTTGSAVNAHISATDGKISRVTSSLRYKQDVEDLDVTVEQVLQLRPVTWRDRLEVLGDPATAQRYPGWIAEEVHAIGGMDVFVVFDQDGLPEALQGDRLSAAQQIVLIDHEARINDALQRLAALEAA